MSGADAAMWANHFNDLMKHYCKKGHQTTSKKDEKVVKCPVCKKAIVKSLTYSDNAKANPEIKTLFKSRSWTFTIFGRYFNFYTSVRPTYEIPE